MARLKSHKTIDSIAVARRHDLKPWKGTRTKGRQKADGRGQNSGGQMPTLCFLRFLMWKSGPSCGWCFWWFTIPCHREPKLHQIAPSLAISFYETPANKGLPIGNCTFGNRPQWERTGFFNREFTLINANEATFRVAFIPVNSRLLALVAAPLPCVLWVLCG